MLVIVSDLHLGDGTTAASIPPSAFEVFARRLNETAYFASWQKDGSYRPIDSLDVILMGDILDPLHSTRWLDTRDLRPWSNPYAADYAPKLLEVTRAILEENKDSLEILRRCASGKSIRLAPATRRKKPDFKTSEQIPLKVRFHYMIGNHDWYYHLPGEAFDQIRAEVIKKMGLCNPVSPFPYEADESPMLKEIFERYQVFARHGDCFDKFNYDSEKGRDYSAVGDAFTMNVCNRYPVEVQKRYGDQLPPGVVESLRRITNIRPALAAPLWISGQIKAHAGADMEDELKGVWDDIAEEFLQLEFVRQADKAFQFDIVDAMELLVKISGHASFSTINDVVVWVHEKMWGGEHSFLNYALQEPAFLNNTARHVVYGHTHHYEIIPLDAKGSRAPYTDSQVYFNSGTWHSYYDLAMKNPKEQKFVPYQALTYITFYADGEHEGRNFDAWSGVYA